MNPVLWHPSETSIESSKMTEFMRFVNDRYSFNFQNYDELYKWSVESFASFWESFNRFSNIIWSKESNFTIDDETKMPGAEWFKGARLNYAENLLRRRDDHTAIHFYGEDKVYNQLTFKDLYQHTSCLAEFFKKQGLHPKDRVAAYMPNLPENVVCMLAAVSCGAIWSSCSPDFGVKGVLDRFEQINPKILIVADGYFFKGKIIDYTDKINDIIQKLPSLECIIRVKYVEANSTIQFQNVVKFDDLLYSNPPEIEFKQLPFSHPMYIMYSSGTTGKPKSIVHSAGGTLIQHLKELKLHVDLRKGESIFYYTTCGWMMWNWLISALATEAAIVLYDGNPFYPDQTMLLNIADELPINVFGTSAKYLSELQNHDIQPTDVGDFNELRAILSTGSPLMDNQFDFVFEKWKKDVQLSSISGGTDIISCFALGNPILPVRKGELQCRGLGMAVESFDENGNSTTDQTGELVCTKPFPSMPVYFWNDENGEKYHHAYFDKFDNIWTHGDFIEIFNHGGLKIHGRSDATLNPGGVRIGTSEIYKVVESMQEIDDSLIIGQNVDGDERLVLFVKLRSDITYSSELNQKIQKEIRISCSPRHVPWIILPIDDVPYTVNGKKVEISVRNIINGLDVTNKDALANPTSLEQFRNIPELKV